jgi:hypothetical protein
MNPFTLIAFDGFHHGFNASLMLQCQPLYYSFGIGAEEEHRSPGGTAATDKHRCARVGRGCHRDVRRATHSDTVRGGDPVHGGPASGGHIDGDAGGATGHACGNVRDGVDGGEVVDGK